MARACFAVAVLSTPAVAAAAPDAPAAATPTGKARPLDLAALERGRVLKAAAAYLEQAPLTITSVRSPRSAGGPHDYFSEADYWWPDPRDPGGPYVRKDGLSNPDNFVEHRRCLVRLSLQVPALAAAFELTRDRRYAAHAERHLRAWFVDEATRMNPSLLYAQAIHGRASGRGTGIIDTLHLVEVALATERLARRSGLEARTAAGVRSWFRQYLEWMTTHPYGVAERDATNNHATCWVAQAAAFARLVGDRARLDDCRRRFETVLLPGQMAEDGSFPRELQRTKPYGYSLFNLEAMAAVAQLLSARGDDLWSFQLADGRGLRRAVAYMAPYIRDKKSWPLPPDVMYDEHWPMRQSSLLFAGLALEVPAYVELWKTLPADSPVEEVIRNFFVRQPLLWVD